MTPTASYSLVEIEMYSLREFSAIYSPFEMTSSKMTPFPVMRKPPTASYSLVGSEMYNIR